ncbi:MAG: nitronate monooxygenase [Bacteroidota bacterium]
MSESDTYFKENPFCKLLGIDYPIIMAPMFLVSDNKMVIEALKCGITAAIPALNYRTDEAFRAAISEIKSQTSKPFGINLIVNKSNLKYKAQLETCVAMEVDFIITSLGSPEETIKRCKPKGIKVFCDVVDLKFAKKVADLGADAIIAVNAEAGGHAGNIPMSELIPLLKSNFNIPIISAGGVATGKQLKTALDLGAEAVSIGTIFIASEESPVSIDYKKALIQYGAKDIVRTSNLSGTPLTVINTPYVQKVGTEASGFQRMLLKNKRLKKWAKMLITYRGMKSVEKSTFGGASYKTFYVAGPTIEDVHEIKPIRKIVGDIIIEYIKADN